MDNWGYNPPYRSYNPEAHLVGIKKKLQFTTISSGPHDVVPVTIISPPSLHWKCQTPTTQVFQDILSQMWKSCPNKCHVTTQTLNDTVDGRNPAPVDMVNNPLFTGIYTSQVVQGFVHQPYVLVFQIPAEVWSFGLHFTTIDRQPPIGHEWRWTIDHQPQNVSTNGRTEW